MQRVKYLLQICSFLMLMFLPLIILSVMSELMDRNQTPVYNFSAPSIFNEMDYSVDILAIGNSNVYSGITPLNWWKEYGFTGYSWGQPSQSIYETYEYLKRIYHYQRPSVVFIEISNIFRDQSYADSINSMVKAKLANLFPVITYHRRLDPDRYPNLFCDGHSPLKGYFFRRGCKVVNETAEKKAQKLFTEEYENVNPISRKYLKESIEYCRRQGSEVVLLFIPSYGAWSYKRHNTLVKEAGENQVNYLDLNIILAETIDWNKDSVDGGEHLNFRGAKKTTDYLGKYLYENNMAKDHRKDSNYKIWDYDLKKYSLIFGRTIGFKE